MTSHCLSLKLKRLDQNRRKTNRLGSAKHNYRNGFSMSDIILKEIDKEYRTA